MLEILPTPDIPYIDKYATLLRNQPGEVEINVNGQNKPKMIGLVGTNPKNSEGLGVAYIVNVKYRGRGYGREAFQAFLNIYWEIEGVFSPSS